MDRYINVGSTDTCMLDRKIDRFQMDRQIDFRWIDRQMLDGIDEQMLDGWVDCICVLMVRYQKLLLWEIVGF